MDDLEVDHLASREHARASRVPLARQNLGQDPPDLRRHCSWAAAGQNESASGLLELDPVAEWVAGVEPPDTGNLAIRADALAARRGQGRLESV
jgi:hypothetical protein